MMNKGVVYALWGYEAQSSDELTFREGDAITILRRKDESETEWWWARLGDREGYVPKNLLGVSPPSAPRARPAAPALPLRSGTSPLSGDTGPRARTTLLGAPGRSLRPRPSVPVSGHVCRARASRADSRASVRAVLSSRGTSASTRSQLEQPTAA